MKIKGSSKLYIGFGFLCVVVMIVGIFALYNNSQQKSDFEFHDMRGQKEVEILLSDDGYRPKNIVIKPGTVVTFSTDRGTSHWPASNLHPTHSIYSAFDSKEPVASDEVWSFKFERKGEWNYHDHLRSYFQGTIEVAD